MLANMPLDGLEKLLRKEIQRNTHTGKKVNMVRYADDFIITGKIERSPGKRGQTAG
ncbi:hypothetical protein [Acidithiobacillus ferrianus]|uniref:hypothetical protein n=1 Tax=Acidithiobacillus ferrianus TaxID=2678518 RepID=UPI003F73D6F0